MRVAIYGAGISGLTCAYRLEQIGFQGEIDLFEEKDGIGVGNIYLNFAAELFYRPIPDMISFLGEKYKLYLNPLYTIERSLNYGPTKVAKMEGFLGHSFIRGNHEASLEKQLQKMIRSPIHYNSKISLEDLQANYDWVVLASGKLHDVPKSIGVRVDRYIKLNHAIVKGVFDPHCVKMWLNNHYAPKGYGYLVPISECQANITLLTPVKDFDLMVGWKRLIQENLYEQFVIEHLQEVRLPIGEPLKLQYGNLYIVGNAAGSITPALGFGLINSFLSGLYAAEAIAEGRNYESLMTQFKKEYRWSLAIRNALEMLDNQMLDLLIDKMNSPLGKKLIKSGGYNFLRTSGRILSALTRELKKSKQAMGQIEEFTGRVLYSNED